MNLSALFRVAQPKYRTDIPSLSGMVPPELNNMFGMEVEVENCKNYIENYQETLAPAWGVTTDGSLRSTSKGSGLEFVSVPLTYTQLVQAVKTLFDKTGFDDSNFTDRCSIHVHANVTDFTPGNLAALALYYQIVEDILFDFVGQHRDSNIYCIPWSQCRMSHDLVTAILGNEAIYSFKGWQKYTALNLSPILTQGTVEFRHMHGTANQDKIFSWITILNNLISLAKKSEGEEAINRVKSLSMDKDYRALFKSIFGEILLYDDKYRGLLDDGIVNAKYSMISLNKKKSALPKRTSLEVERAIADEEAIGAIAPATADVLRRMEQAYARNAAAIAHANAFSWATAPASGTLGQEQTQPRPVVAYAVQAIEDTVNAADIGRARIDNLTRQSDQWTYVRRWNINNEEQT